MNEGVNQRFTTEMKLRDDSLQAAIRTHGHLADAGSVLDAALRYYEYVNGIAKSGPLETPVHHPV